MEKKISYIERPEEKDELLYTLIVGKSGRGWLYPVNSSHPADNIYCTNSADWKKCGEGFGGSTIKLPLVDEPDNALFLLKGGWHSNSVSLLYDTGVDITDKNLTRCVISLKQEGGFGEYVLDDILVEENVWVVSEFDRPNKLAKEYANKLGKKVFLYFQSLGGGSFGWVQPD
jgi:hypothetical protein